MSRDPYKPPKTKPCKCGATEREWHDTGDHGMVPICAGCKRPLKVKWFG